MQQTQHLIECQLSGGEQARERILYRVFQGHIFFFLASLTSPPRQRLRRDKSAVEGSCEPTVELGVMAVLA